MPVVQTQTNTAGIVNTSVGRYLTDATAAAIPITVGFKPRHVRIVNVTSRDEMEWFEGMAAASAVKTVAAGTRTLITTNGITVSDSGFTIGLDTDVNVINEQISWIAQG
jgi:hypothetical protein